ncbi:MAG TPA: DJ-1/PfpI family protein [Acidimicrobiia bacterium]
MQIAVLLFDKVYALDAVGPYEVLRGIPGAGVCFVAADPGPKPTESGALALVADHALHAVPNPDIVVVPGGAGEVDARADRRVIDWLQVAHEGSQWTTSVCTGALVLGAAGLLEGKRATSHWTALDALRQFGAEPVGDERVVFDGKVVTAAGVSAGIDMALTLAERVAGPDVAQAIQLEIEYDPQPPFDTGSTAKAPPELVARLRAASRFARAT